MNQELAGYAKLVCMHFYSHLVVAQALLPHLQPVSLPEYYWGAVAPDIRYAAGMRRKQTHRPAAEVRGWLDSAPEMHDFILGYLVHILTDERDAAGTLYDGFPIRAIRRRLPRSLAAALLESAYIDSVPLAVQLAGTDNALLQEMGVPRALLTPFAQAANRYASAPSLPVALELLSGLGLQGSPRLQRYLRIARWLESYPRVRRLVTSRVDVIGVTRRIMDDLLRQIPLYLRYT
jgi:hypothetical protein